VQDELKRHLNDGSSCIQQTVTDQTMDQWWFRLRT